MHAGRSVDGNESDYTHWPRCLSNKTRFDLSAAPKGSCYFDILTLTRADKATSLDNVMQTIEAWSGEVFVVRVHLKAR